MVSFHDFFFISLPKSHILKYLVRYFIYDRLSITLLLINNLISIAEFVRYSIYLCFVLTISLVCYCTGICVAWNRRSSFADPLNLLGK